MTAGGRGPFRIALIDHSSGELAAELSAAEIVSPRGVRLVEKVLRYRGFATPLTHVPFAVAELRRGGFDVAQAFTPQDAVAALLWRRSGGGPVVFSPGDPPRRETLADRRLGLRLLERALEESDAVVALTEQHRDAFLRWLALDVPVIEPRDAAGWERLYRGLLESRA